MLQRGSVGVELRAVEVLGIGDTVVVTASELGLAARSPRSSSSNSSLSSPSSVQSKTAV